MDQTRDLARGLLLSDIDESRLIFVLRELAAATSAQFPVRCTCLGEESVQVGDAATASHLYRIAQEAVRNAARHSGAARIWITLLRSENSVILSVEDDGRGLPPEEGRGRGLGLRIMAHRATMIGARFFIEPGPDVGTRVGCVLPVPPKSS
jgi:signal transduction histidine kinase